MKRVWQIGLAVVMWMCVLATFSNAQQPGTARQGSGGGWTIPPTAAGEKNPLTANDATIGDGKKLFTAKCQRCHGASGKGDGADADPAHKTDMDLTAAARRAQPRRRRLLQDLERPYLPEDAGVLGRAQQRAGLVTRHLRPDAAR
jgi:hypothetical protein